jgi:hypothetical protein
MAIQISWLLARLSLFFFATASKTISKGVMPRGSNWAFDNSF